MAYLENKYCLYSDQLIFNGALGSIDPGSNPGSPIISILFLRELKLFAELKVEYCVIRFFKWFSKVLLRLKPSSLDFSTSSLSKYKTTFLLFDVTNASEGKRMDGLCYKCGHRTLFLSFNLFLYRTFIGKNAKTISNF